MLLSRYRLVLVRPKFAGNVGAAARVAANFDLGDCVLVRPECDWGSWEAKKLATGASRERIAEFRVASDLHEALADCEGAVGFSRRSGKLRKPTLELGEIPFRVGGERIALVFGNEENGLTEEELRACTQMCTIPTSEVLPSMNLSHAVALVAGRIFEIESARLAAKGPALVRGVPSGESSPARLRELEDFYRHWRELLLDAGLNQAGNPERILVHLREVFNRARLRSHDIRLFRGVLSKVQVALGTRKRGRRVLPAE